MINIGKETKNLKGIEKKHHTRKKANTGGKEVRGKREDKCLST